jgi:hypothetical protein
MQNPGSDAGVFVGMKSLVIPGRASWREPGIHNPKCRFVGDHYEQAWLWIPGSALLRRPGMTRQLAIPR